jgi:K+/H+ antiporter YhaU regulatory subunit KhtT
MFEKQIEAEYDDTVTVEHYKGGHNVYLTLDDETNEVFVVLTPEQAKEVRKALKKAARRAEANR